MSIENITMPQLGESVTEGTIEKWFVKPGDKVNKYDPLAEVNTDKVNAEIPSSFSGVIKELIAVEGQTLPIGAVLCTIDVNIQNELRQPEEKKSYVSKAIYNAGVQKSVQAPKREQPVSDKIVSNEQKQKSRYSPAVMRLATEHNIPLHDVVGTGGDGRITRKDIQKMIDEGFRDVSTLQQPKEEHAEDLKQFEDLIPPSVNKMTLGDMEIPITSVRKAIANNMVKSKREVPHAWMMMEVDVTSLVAYRDAIKDQFKEQQGFNLTYFAFFVKAVAQALKEFPMMNSMWAGDKIIQRKDINLSIAVATEDALFVPVLKNADEKTIKGIAREIHEFSQKVRTGKLSHDDMQGGTFTVNNTGSFGSVQSMGIINHPQAAILQVEKIIKKPIIMNGGMFAARDMVNLCLSLDHRILDGLICGRFLNRVKNILENVNKVTTNVF